MKTEKQEIFETYCEYIFVKGWSKEKAFKKISRFYNVFISTLEKWYEEENWEQKITDEDWQARAIAKNEERLKRKEKGRMRRKKEQQAIKEEKAIKEEDMKKLLNRGKRFKRYRCPNCSLPIEECTCGYFDELTEHKNDKPEMNKDAESNLSSKFPKNGENSSFGADVSVGGKKSGFGAVVSSEKKSSSKPKVSKSIKKSKKEKDILKKTSKTSIQLSANQEKILSEISDSIKGGYKFIVLEANEGNSDIAVKLANNFVSSIILTSNEKSQMRYNKKYNLGKNSNIYLSNQKNFFNERNNIKEGDLLVIDGAHRLDENIADLFSYPIYLDEYRDLVNNFKCRFKDLPDEDYTTWLDFIKHLRLDNDKVKRVAACIKQNPNNWICSYDSKNKKLSFYPLNIGNLAKDYWFSKCDVCVLISSTILDLEIFSKELGLDISQIKFIPQDVVVNTDRNIVYARKTANISNRKLLIRRIEEILENHKNERGVILTGKRNYKGIFRRINDQRINILGDYDYHKKIKKFIEVSDSVIVTDSLEDEIEFPYELCKFQIIMNVHAHTFDKRFENKENEYGGHSYKKNIDFADSLKKLAVSESDSCITYVLDDDILTAVAYDITHNKILPEYAIDSIVDLDMNDCGFVSKNIKKQFGVYYKFDYYKDRKSENKDIWAYKDYNKESPDIYLKEFNYFTTELMKAISELSNDIIDSSIKKLALVAVPSSTIKRNKSSTMKESINVIESWQDEGKARSDFNCKKEIINCGDLLKRVTDVTTAHLSKNLSKPRPSYVEHTNSIECEKKDILEKEDVAFIILDDISTRGTIMNACEDVLIKKRKHFQICNIQNTEGVTMIKLKEILFLKNLYRVGKSKIYTTYWKMLEDCDALYDLADVVEKNFDFSSNEIKKAMDNSERMYDNIVNLEMEIITVFDENYPEKLNVMGNKRPLILYARGNLDALTKPNIGIIGTRKPSLLSQEFEQNMVKNIVNSTDRVVVSGLALGCDKIAHQATVDENKITVAVLPGDVFKIKPASHKKLAEDIINAGGCLISEYEPGVKVQKGNYIDRDKVVAALSDALFVVECGINSGTMHTVDFAKEYERPIYSYLPDERPEGSYDGNEYILKNYEDVLKVEDIEEFLEYLNALKIKKSTKSVQLTLI